MLGRVDPTQERNRSAACTLPKPRPCTSVLVSSKVLKAVGKRSVGSPRLPAWQRNSPLDIHHGQAHWGAAPCSVLARTGFEWRSQRDRRLHAVEWYRVRAHSNEVNLEHQCV